MKKAFVIILVNLIILLPLPAMGQEDSLAVRPFTEHPLGLLEGRVAGVEVISSAGVPGLKPTHWFSIKGGYNTMTSSSLSRPCVLNIEGNVYHGV